MHAKLPLIKKRWRKKRWEKRNLYEMWIGQREVAPNEWIEKDTQKGKILNLRNL